LVFGFSVIKSGNLNEQFLTIDIINNSLLYLAYSINSVKDLDFNNDNKILSLSIINSDTTNEISIWEFTLPNGVISNPKFIGSIEIPFNCNFI
jgi:hypothetical protein